MWVMYGGLITVIYGDLMMDLMDLMVDRWFLDDIDAPSYVSCCLNPMNTIVVNRSCVHRLSDFANGGHRL